MKHSFLSDAGNITLVRNALIDWFDKEGRSFPWRETTDPYHVLIAEMLLRRTTAAAVLRVYPKFIKQFDNPTKLSKARDEYRTFRAPPNDFVRLILGDYDTEELRTQNIDFIVSKEMKPLVETLFPKRNSFIAYYYC